MNPSNLLRSTVVGLCLLAGVVSGSKSSVITGDQGIAYYSRNPKAARKFNSIGDVVKFLDENGKAFRFEDESPGYAKGYSFVFLVNVWEKEPITLSSGRCNFWMKIPTKWLAGIRAYLNKGCKNYWELREHMKCSWDCSVCHLLNRNENDKCNRFQLG